MPASAAGSLDNACEAEVHCRSRASGPLARRAHQVDDSLTMHLKLRHAIGVAVAVAAAAIATLVLSLATASAQSGPGVTVTVPGTTAGTPTTTATVPTTTGAQTPTVPVACKGCGGITRGYARVDVDHRHPVAGKLFKGLTIRKVRGGTISWVECDAKIAGKRLPARQQSFYAGPHQRQKVICRWRVPADTAGKRLRLCTYEGAAWVVHISPHTVERGRVGYWDSTSWIVKRQ
jgi:hypothetical protein